MNNSNKAIAKRINKELKSRDWSQADLLKKIIKYKHPDISKADLQAEVIKKKGNFSTTLKGVEKRSVSKEDLYIISKIFSLPLEYIWFGDEKKSGFVPSGARYAAYQDDESEYCAYIASLEHEDNIQNRDEFGFNLFDYFGQYDSINGYKFFIKNYDMHFDYVVYGQLVYTNKEGYEQFCSICDKNNIISDNLLKTLVKYNDVKTFKTIYFDNCSLNRFNANEFRFYKKNFFGEDFLETLLKNEPFLNVVLKTKEVELNNFNKYYSKNEKRNFVEPMFYEVLTYALDHEDEYKEQLIKLLNYALEYCKTQYEFIKEYMRVHKDEEYGDVHIEQYSPRFLKSSNGVQMGNVIEIRKNDSDKDVDCLLKEIDQLTFNMTHIINEQEKNNEEIKISTPENSLFVDFSKNASDQNISFVPKAVHIDKEFTYFKYYESSRINFDSHSDLQFIIDCLNKAQDLVPPKAGKVFVHGKLSNAAFMVENNKNVGLTGWQRCHYGNKYEDRAELLSNINSFFYREDYLKNCKELFDIIAQGFNQDERIKLIDMAIEILDKKRKDVISDEGDNISKAYSLKEKSSKLELFKEIYFQK